MSTEHLGIEQHPDVIAMREHYDEVAAAPTAQALDGLVLLAGLYIACSPWILGFNNLRTLTVNNLIVGLAIAILATGFAAVYGRMHGVAWVAPILGAWTVISQWLISGNVDTTTTILSNVISGGVVVVAGIVALAGGTRLARRRS